MSLFINAMRWFCEKRNLKRRNIGFRRFRKLYTLVTGIGFCIS